MKRTVGSVVAGLCSGLANHPPDPCPAHTLEKTMSRFSSLCLAAILAIALVATTVQAEEITNSYFTLNVPEGWTKTVAPVQNGAVTVLLQNGSLSLSISVTPDPIPARELAMKTAQNMKFSGIRSKEPVQQGDSCTVAFEQKRKKVSGMSYFTSNGSQGSIITIMAPTDTDGFARAKAFLQENLKPADARLFPARF